MSRDQDEMQIDNHLVRSYSEDRYHAASTELLRRHIYVVLEAATG